MLKLIKITLYVFLSITAITALVVLAGLIRLWFFQSEGLQSDLPHLKYLLILLIAEVITVVSMFARKGAKYLPHVENHKKEEDTLVFMRNFIAGGSTVQIVSSRLSWINNSKDLYEEVIKKAEEGTLVEVITPKEITDDTRIPLTEAGVRFYDQRQLFLPSGDS